MPEVIPEKKKVTGDQLVSLIDGLKKQVDDQANELAELKTKAAQTPNIPYGINGRIPSDHEPYSMLKIGAYSLGRIDREQVKFELDSHIKLKELYKKCGWRPMNGNSVLVPQSISNIPIEDDADRRLVSDIKYKMYAGSDNVDPDEIQSLRRKGLITKDLGTISDSAGGTLVGFPTLGELIDLQRKVEVFAKAGATETTLPPNGRIQFPKLTNSTTAYWIGEGAAITESTPATGYLDLQAKKLGIFVDINNELLRFSSISAEAAVRGDMAKVGGLAMDLACLEGAGGTSIKGLITYTSASSWTPGEDKLLAYTVTSNLIQVKDGAEMEALLPDTAGDPTAWVMRRDVWTKLRNRRAAAFSTGDNEGPYLASITRDLQNAQKLEWEGIPVVRSSQVSNTRSSTKSYVLLGYFPDWIIARFGVMEFLMGNTGDTALANDLTRLRAIQHVDAGARHASSFVFADNVNIA